MGNKIDGVLGTLMVLSGISLALSNAEVKGATQKFGLVTTILGVTILERTLE